MPQLEFHQLDRRLERAETMFDATMKGAVPPDKLGAIWKSLATQLGSFKMVIASHQEPKGDYLNVYETCEFGATNFDLIVTFDKQGQIAGFHAAPASYVPTEEKPSAGVIELAVKVEGLDGALTLPQSGGPFPGLVLVHGSGPQDRDETIGRNKPFRDLAWGLASRGIAVLRYDKRKNFPTDATVRQETIDDAVAAAALLRKTERIDPRNVVVLGHSLGGYLIPRIAAAAPDVRGFISLAGATRPLEDMLVEQAQTLGGIPAEAKAIAAKIRTIKPGDPPVFGASAAYWTDLRGYDPAVAARAIDRPMLIL